MKSTARHALDADIRSDIISQTGVIKHTQDAYVLVLKGLEHAIPISAGQDEAEIDRDGHYEVCFFGNAGESIFFSRINKEFVVYEDRSGMTEVLKKAFPKEAELAHEIALSEDAYNAIEPELPKLEGTQAQVEFATKIRRAAFALNQDEKSIRRQTSAVRWIDHKAMLRGINTLD